MSEIRDNFIKTLDHSECGIGEKFGFDFFDRDFFILIDLIILLQGWTLYNKNIFNFTRLWSWDIFEKVVGYFIQV